jgi:hypothetical protein
LSHFNSGLYFYIVTLGNGRLIAMLGDVCHIATLGFVHHIATVGYVCHIATFGNVSHIMMPGYLCHIAMRRQCSSHWDDEVIFVTLRQYKMFMTLR